MDSIKADIGLYFGTFGETLTTVLSYFNIQISDTLNVAETRSKTNIHNKVFRTTNLVQDCIVLK
jgi:hypothetical protein